MNIIERFEPKLKDIEEEYRQHYLRTDAEQLFAFVVLTATINIGFLFVESWQYFPQQRFYILVIIRSAYLCFSAYFLAFLMRNKQPRIYDIFVLVWALATVIISFVARLSHSATTPAIYTIDVALVIGFYLIAPTTLYYRTISAFALTALAIFSIFTMDQQIIIPDKIAVATTLLGANIIAFISSSRAYTYRRNQYKATIETNILTKELAILADTDPLTGILNRRRFLQFAEDEIQEFARYHNTFSLALFDLDQFKEINDQFGHHTGDMVLNRFCEIVSSILRETDRFGRLGGDEFGLLLPYTSLPSAIEVAKRIQKKVENEVIPVDNHQIHITISIGIVEATSETNQLEHLLQKVDSLLYRAKQNGRNRTEF